MAVILEWEEQLASLEDQELFDMAKALEKVSSWEFLAKEFQGITIVATLARLEKQGRISNHVEALRTKSLNDVDKLYRDGYLSEDVTLAYIDEWNKGLRFTKAVLRGGRITNEVKED